MNYKAWLWRAGKLLLVAAIVLFVGRQFAQDLRRLDWQTLELRPGWLLASAALYLAGLGCSGLFWYRLLHRFGERPRAWAALRAYYVGHLGKYVPGKAMALLVRASLVRGAQVRLGTAILAAFYEVLTTMAAGALLAAAIFIMQPPQISGLQWNPVLTGLLLLVLAGVPVLPGVFNRVVGKLAARFQSVDSFRLPKLRMLTLLEGLMLASCGWLLLGLSTWCVLNAVLPAPAPLNVQTGPHLIATVSLSYVAGFLAIFVPGGLGVRESLLRLLLDAVSEPAQIALAILLLRVVWTAAEIVCAALVYFLPVPRESNERTD